MRFLCHQLQLPAHTPLFQFVLARRACAPAKLPTLDIRIDRSTAGAQRRRELALINRTEAAIDGSGHRARGSPWPWACARLWPIRTSGIRVLGIYVSRTETSWISINNPKDISNGPLHRTVQICVCGELPCSDPPVRRDANPIQICVSDVSKWTMHGRAEWPLASLTGPLGSDSASCVFSAAR
jgi:hypothetical protein